MSGVQTKCVPKIIIKGISGVAVKNKILNFNNLILNRVESIISRGAGQHCKGDYKSLTLTNYRPKGQNKGNRTVLKYACSKGNIEASSDRITKLLGQENYDNLYNSLQSLDEQKRIDAFVSLLTPIKFLKSAETQTPQIQHTCATSQTEDFSMIISDKKRTRVRKKPVPYLVEPSDRNSVTPKSKTTSVPESKESLLDISELVDDDSEIDNCSMVSCKSIDSIGTEVENEALKILEVVNKSSVPNTSSTYTNLHSSFGTYRVIMKDGRFIDLPCQPQDELHLTAPEILKQLSPAQQVMLLSHQVFLDWKYSLIEDEDGNLPIHNAVLNDDLNLLIRQSVVLKCGGYSVDIEATEQEISPLHMSVTKGHTSCTNILLKHGADPLHSDAKGRTPLHSAKLKDMQILLDYCTRNSREYITNNTIFSGIDVINKTDEELRAMLFTKISELYDEDGYTPLMLASKQGLYGQVQQLLKATEIALKPYKVDMTEIVDRKMVNTGNTALFLSVEAICIGNEIPSVAENYLKTIEVLLSFKANPSVCNNFGANVNSLLNDQETPNVKLSDLLVRSNLAKIDAIHPPDGNRLMILKTVQSLNEGRLKRKMADKQNKYNKSKR